MVGLLILGAILLLLLEESEKGNEGISDKNGSSGGGILGRGQRAGTTGNRRSGLKRKRAPIRRIITEEYQETESAEKPKDAATESVEASADGNGETA